MLSCHYTYVHVSGSKINALGLLPDAVPVLLVIYSFKYKDENKTVFYISRTQLHLLPAYAFIANKIQGQSLQHALVDLVSAKGTQALYVMISWAVCLDNLAVLHWFPLHNVDHRLSEVVLPQFVPELRFKHEHQ
jgi:hypothetical protein